MPSKKQDFTFPQLNKEEILLFSFGASKELGWKPLYAGPDALVMYTPRSWKKKADEIFIRADAGKMIITSNMVNGESFDLFGRNKRNIDEFIIEFGKIKSSKVKEEWVTALEEMRQRTIEAATVQSKQQDEVEKIMHASGSNLYITYSIIGINILVFILMALNGAGVFTPEGNVHIRWGSNYSSLTLTGEWWRLITCMFLHFGIVHLAMNCYALYMAGAFLEPMLGKTRYITAYLSTGVIASIASLWWHTEGVNSAGASGAIFGLYGVFLALLLTNLIPKQVRMPLLQSIGIFVLFNLFYGMKSGIDNAAHIGGLLSGMIIGFIFYLELGKKINVKNLTLVLLISVATATGAWYFLKNFKSDAVRITAILDNFSFLEEKALENLKTTDTTTAIVYKERLIKNVLPAWEKSLEEIKELKTLKISEKIRASQQMFERYIELRIEETKLLIKAQDAPAGNYDKEIEDVDKEIEKILKQN